MPIKKSVNNQTGLTGRHELSSELALQIKQACSDPVTGLWTFQQTVVGPMYPGGNAAIERIHGRLCEFLANPIYGLRRDITVPRSFFKTATCSILFALWYVTCINPKARLLIVCSIITLAENIIHAIKGIVESNQIYRSIWPEMVPAHRKVPWADRKADLGQGLGAQEGNFTAAGVGGGATSMHFEGILEDDLIYPKKDALSGQEIRPSLEDIEKAIGFHKMNTSLLANPRTGFIYNIGTRFAPKDLKNYIKTNQSGYYSFFSMASEVMPDGSEVLEPLTGQPTWPERFGQKELEGIYNDQGSWLYSTQYLQRPLDIGSKVFRLDDLRYWRDFNELPLEFKSIRTIIDLATWTEDSRKARSAYNVVHTIGLDQRNHVWLLRYYRGNYDPGQIYEKTIESILWVMKTFGIETSVHIEEVYYQAALRFIAQEFMQRDGKYFLMKKLPLENWKDAKDHRIRKIHPVASAHALHVHESMKEFVQEYDDYPLTRSKDLLDTLGWFLRIEHLNLLDIFKEPGIIKIPDLNVISCDSIIEELENRRREKNYPIHSNVINLGTAGNNDELADIIRSNGQRFLLS